MPDRAQVLPQEGCEERESGRQLKTQRSKRTDSSSNSSSINSSTQSSSQVKKSNMSPPSGTQAAVEDKSVVVEQPTMFRGKGAYYGQFIAGKRRIEEDDEDNDSVVESSDIEDDSDATLSDTCPPQAAQEEGPSGKPQEEEGNHWGAPGR